MEKTVVTNQSVDKTFNRIVGGKNNCLAAALIWSSGKMQLCHSPTNNGGFLWLPIWTCLRGFAPAVKCHVGAEAWLQPNRRDNYPTCVHGRGLSARHPAVNWVHRPFNCCWLDTLIANANIYPPNSKDTSSHFVLFLSAVVLRPPEELREGDDGVVTRARPVRLTVFGKRNSRVRWSKNITCPFFFTLTSTPSTKNPHKLCSCQQSGFFPLTALKTAASQVGHIDRSSECGLL